MKYSGVPWIGDIPKEWRTATLLQVLRSRISDGPHETPNLVDDGIPFISVDSLNESEDIDLKIVKKFISEEDYIEYSKKTQLEIGDILFTKSATIGKTAIVKNDRFMIWSPIAVLKPNNLILNKFLYHLVSNGNFKDYVCQLSTFNTQFNIGMRTLEKAKISLPSYSEQQKIASFLDTKCAEVEEMIILQEKIIEELKAYKQSVITEAVTKGLNPNVPMKESGIEWIGQIPAHWEVHRVKRIVQSFSKGEGITKEEVFVEGDISCVRYGEIYSKYNQSFIECISSTNLNIHKSPRYFGCGDILCAGTGELVEEIGKSIVYLGQKRCLAGGDIIVIRHKQNPIFLNYALNSTYAQSQKSCSKSKLKVVHISASNIGNILLPIPSLAEQQFIADYLDEKCSNIDSLINIKQQKIENLKEYKKSIIYEYVTGKKEVED